MSALVRQVVELAAAREHDRTKQAHDDLQRRELLDGRRFAVVQLSSADWASGSLSGMFAGTDDRADLGDRIGT